MSDYKYLKASDGTGEAALAHVTLARSVAGTTLEVDSVDNWPDEFICTTGELLPSGLLDPATMTQFRGHLNSGDIIIDSFEPGYADNGNTTDEIAIIKQTSGWADLVAEYARVATPSGMVVPYAGDAAPDAWLLCYGQSLVRASYPDLFAAIGTVYGAADGTHFNVPDLRGRVPAGQDDMGGSSANRLTNPGSTTGGIDGDVLGGTGGVETHVLTVAQLATHGHSVKGGFGTGGAAVDQFVVGSSGAGVAGPTDPSGSGTAHNNVQPTLILNYIIKV